MRTNASKSGVTGLPWSWDCRKVGGIPNRLSLESYFKMYSGNNAEAVKGNTFVDAGRDLEETLKPWSWHWNTEVETVGRLVNSEHVVNSIMRTLSEQVQPRVVFRPRQHIFPSVIAHFQIGLRLKYRTYTPCGQMLGLRLYILHSSGVNWATQSVGGV